MLLKAEEIKTGNLYLTASGVLYLLWGATNLADFSCIGFDFRMIDLGTVGQAFSHAL
jgi:hypothetical protein